MHEGLRLVDNLIHLTNSRYRATQVDMRLDFHQLVRPLLDGPIRHDRIISLRRQVSDVVTEGRHA